MRVHTEPLHARSLTGRRMYALSRFSGDLGRVYVRRQRRPVALAKLPLTEYHDFVRRIPYRRDDKPVEVVSRPKYILQCAGGGADCKKKAILLGAWFQARGLRPLRQWRFIAVSKRPDREIHHVLPQVLVSGVWRNADATYKYMRLYQPQRVTAMEVLRP